MKYESNRTNVDAELLQRKTKALAAIGLFAQGAAQYHCPVDTGNLRSSLTHASDDKQAIIGTNVEYAAAVELGIKQHAQPFLRSAVEDNIKEIQHITEEYMSD